MSAKTLVGRKDVRDLDFSPGRLITRPDLALLIAQVIETWSHIDAAYVALASAVLETEPLVATAMLQAIDNQTTQRAVVLATAKASLTLKDSRLFTAVSEEVDAARRARHRFAHHLWGISTQLPESLLTIDPKRFNATKAQWKKWSTQAIKDGATVFLTRGSEWLLPDVFVWTKKDLSAHVAESLRAHDLVQKLAVMAFMHFTSSCDALRDTLLSDPAIKRRYLKLQAVAP